MDSSSFAGTTDPFGNATLDPSGDFFRPLAPPTNAIPKLAPAAAIAATAPTATGGVSTFFKQNARSMTLFVLLLAIAVVGFIVYQARRKANNAKTPFCDDIAKVEDGEKRQDLKELEYMWQISRRATVRTMLGEMIKMTLESVVAQPPPPPLATPETTGGSQATDPFFTAA